MKTSLEYDYNLPKEVILREWQKECIEEFLGKVVPGIALEKLNTFLAVACPGSGKTIVMLALAYILRKRGLTNWVTICVPSAHLTVQVALVAQRLFGLNLYHGTSGEFSSDKWDGDVATYQSVCRNPELWRARCSNKRLFLVADEVHHVADTKAWGESFKSAFDGARYRLLASGTPFRSDNEAIPYITYVLAKDDPNEEGKLISQADYSYGYGDALKDGVCRHVIFPSYEGEFEWISGDTVYKKKFSDELPKSQISKRRRTCLKADDKWVSKVVKDANDRLSKIRKGFGEGCHKDAGGLIVCIDKSHAYSIAETLKNKTGEDATVVTSDDQLASEKIKAFAQSDERWIIAVKMVSEGIDIPRLRIVVFATNVTTLMYFRQIMGRITRMIGKYDDETAYMYIYDDEVVVRLAMEVKEEINHVLAQQEKELEEEDDLWQSENGGGQRPLNLFVPISAEGSESQHLWNGESYSAQDLDRVRPHAFELGIPEAKALELIKRFGPNVATVEKVEEQATQAETKSERRTRLRKKIATLAKNLAYMLAPKDPDFELVHRTWRSSYPGSQGQAKASEKELTQKVNWLTDCISQGLLISVDLFLEKSND